VGYALGVAEEALQFEHRDLHWGNVLVRPTDKEDITFRLMGKPVVVPTQGVEACVIDFTMSRLTKGN
jgi:serine/threonine-protein kinase haspin